MMGMFDELRCDYPLPVEGANDLVFQTKDTPTQFIDLYKITEDGHLLLQEFDEVKTGKMVKILNTIEVEETRRENYRFTDFPLTGEVRFYTSFESDPNTDEYRDEWVEFSAYFVKGELKHLETIEAPRQRTKAYVD